MKKLPLFAVLTALFAVTFFTPSYGQDPDWKRPGTEEAAAVDEATAKIDVAYKQLMSKLDAQGQKALREAQRSWIKWRDNEAMLIARVGGAIGGSGLRVDYSNAQAKLIRERTEVLKGYAQQSIGN